MQYSNECARPPGRPKHIVLAEGEDRRTIAAAALIIAGRIARVTLIGIEEIIRDTASQMGCALTGATVVDNKRSSDRDRLAAAYYDLRRAKGVTLDEARRQMDDPLYFANMLVREGRADGSVSGATHTTAHTVGAALRCIGPRPGLKTVSSFFVIVVPSPDLGAHGASILWIAGGNRPTASEKAEIAIASADSARMVLEISRGGNVSIFHEGQRSFRWRQSVEATRTAKFGRRS
jgi:phosphate acetyltransferase